MNVRSHILRPTALVLLGLILGGGAAYAVSSTEASPVVLCVEKDGDVEAQKKGKCGSKKDLVVKVASSADLIALGARVEALESESSGGPSAGRAALASGAIPIEPGESDGDGSPQGPGEVIFDRLGLELRNQCFNLVASSTQPRRPVSRLIPRANTETVRLAVSAYGMYLDQTMTADTARASGRPAEHVAIGVSVVDGGDINATVEAQSWVDGDLCRWTTRAVEY